MIFLKFLLFARNYSKNKSGIGIKNKRKDRNVITKNGSKHDDDSSNSEDDDDDDRDDDDDLNS